MTRNSQEFDWQAKYRDRITTAAAAMEHIKPGNTILIGGGCGVPQHLVKAMVEHTPNVYDAHIVQLLTVGEAPYADPKFKDKFKVNNFFIGDNIRGLVDAGIGDYTPIHMSEIPMEFEEGRIPVDVALVQVSPPDSRGQCSLGVSVDIVKSAVENARYVIAQVNPRMPRTVGASFIHVNQIDWLVPHEEPLVELTPPAVDDRLNRIGENVARLIEDGSTLELGIGSIGFALAKHLKDKKDLGIHTELFGDWIVDLVESKVINSAKKTVNRGKITASLCLGSKKLYDYINNNPVFEFYPTDYVNDPFVIAKHDKMVAINMGMEIDLTGQVASDSIGQRFYSGFGGQLDFARGAARSRGGKSIMALPSTARDETVSRIVPSLSQGAGVVTTRADVHYVVTEYGIAYLHGKTIRDRALALISIAHPKFRKELTQAAKSLRYVYEDQIELSWETVKYPGDLERRDTLRDGTEMFFRPVKPADEQPLSEMLYSLSAESVRSRFFTHTKTFPHKDVQQLTNIDYEQNLAIIGIVPGPGGEEQIVAIAQYFLDPKTQAAEVAFIVQDDWQLKGVGTVLFNHLCAIGQKRGIKKFVAKVLPQNKPMLGVFNNSEYPVKTEFDGESYGITVDLRKEL